jgi:hypothetical protein
MQKKPIAIEYVLKITQEYCLETKKVEHGQNEMLESSEERSLTLINEWIAIFLLQTTTDSL